MRKIISFMHISFDGFVAGPNGEMNWIIVDEEIRLRLAYGVYLCASTLILSGHE